MPPYSQVRVAPAARVWRVCEIHHSPAGAGFTGTTAKRQNGGKHQEDHSFAVMQVHGPTWPGFPYPRFVAVHTLSFPFRLRKLVERFYQSRRDKWLPQAVQPDVTGLAGEKRSPQETEDDLNAWLAEVRLQSMERLKRGPVVL